MVTSFPGGFLTVVQLTPASGLHITGGCSTIGREWRMCAPVNVDRIGDNMATSPTFDADKLRATSEQLRDAAAVYAGKVAVRAADLANQGVDWAAPRAQAALTSAIEHATPAIENAAARAQAAAAHAGPAIENAREHLVDDYLPRASLAVNQAGAALTARGSLSDRARRASEVSAVALTTPTRKRRKCRFLRAFGLTALVGAAAEAPPSTRAPPTCSATFSMQCTRPIFGRRKAFGSPSISPNPPVVYAKRGTVRSLALNRGKPTRRPFRSPLRLFTQFDKAFANDSRPLEYASLEFSPHQITPSSLTASASLFAFHHLRSE